MYEVLESHVYYIFESKAGHEIFYKNIINEWLSNANKIVREVRNAKYVIKNGKGRSVFYHALQNKYKQATIFLIDCTDSNFTDAEIYEQINRVFKYKETQYVEIIIVKNGNNLFGIFKKGK